MVGLKFFFMADHIELNSTEVTVHFDKKISIDCGYEVKVDEVSAPLNSSSKDVHSSQSLASSDLVPDEK